VVEVVDDELAALAIAAPPPATAAVTTSVVIRDLSRWFKVIFTSLGWSLPRTVAPEPENSV
jgi:hypothetical protein